MKYKDDDLLSISDISTILQVERIVVYRYAYAEIIPKPDVYMEFKTKKKRLWKYSTLKPVFEKFKPASLIKFEFLTFQFATQQQKEGFHAVMQESISKKWKSSCTVSLKSDWMEDK